MDIFQIEPNDDTGKGRVFRAGLLGFVSCTWLWPQPSENERPVFMVYAGTDVQIRAFSANLQTGRKAKIPKGTHGRLSDGTVFECLRSAGYAFATQRFSGLSVVTVYLPEFFDRNPGMVDPEKIQFLAAPSVEWRDAYLGRNPDVAPVVAHVLKVRKSLKRSADVTAEKLAELVPSAALFAAYLDPRTRAPLIADPRFHLQLLVACVDAGFLRFAGEKHWSWGEAAWGEAEHKQFYSYGTAEMKLDRVFGFRATHAKFAEVLAIEVARYFRFAGT